MKNITTEINSIISRLPIPLSAYCKIMNMQSIIFEKTRGWHGARFSYRGGFVLAIDCENKSELTLASHKRSVRYLRTGVNGIKKGLISRYFPSPILQDCITGATIVDVGANIGEFSQACFDYGAAKVISIEPDQFVVPALRRNLKNLNVEIYEELLSAEAQVIDFFYSTDNADSSSYPPSSWTEKKKIQSIRLDVLLAGRKIDILKVEAEGTEPEVLEGAAQILFDIPLVTVRASNERGGESTFPACEEILKKYGFKITSGPDGKQLIATKDKI